MNAQIAAYGRLGHDPKEITTQTGKLMATASIAVDVSRRNKEEDSAPLWIGLVAFGRKADALLRHKQGDLISVSGRLQVNRWRDDTGNEHERLQVVLDAIVSVRMTRPGGKQKAVIDEPSTTDTESQPRGGEGVPFDDSIPF